MAIATRPSTDTRSFPRRWTALWPGITASLVVSVLAVGLDQLQARVFGRVIVEAIVLAILVGMVAAAIALSAVLGVAMVLWLPLLIKPFGLSNYQYGALAGLTIYAVPQVLAAGFAVSALSGQVATAVKLARVLMLGPVVLFFFVRRARTAGGAHMAISLGKIAPWFVLGFLLLAALRTAGAIGDPIAAGAKSAASWLTIAAMAALGLSVDVRSVRRVGARVSCAVGGALVVLVVLALALIKLLALP